MPHRECAAFLPNGRNAHFLFTNRNTAGHISDESFPKNKKSAMLPA